MAATIPGLVSTIIPVFNRSQMLREAVASVMSQSHRPIEIIIVDDGSTDETPRTGDELMRQHPEEITFIRIANSGPGPAREAGRLLARGEFLQYLDSDDRLLPEKFEVQIASLRANPNCDISYGLTRLIDNQGNCLDPVFKWTGRDIPKLFPGLLVDRWWCTHTPLYRRTLTDAIGPWSSLRWSQDWEHDARAGALNVCLAYCDVLVSEHRHHDGVRQTSGANWRTDPIRLTNRRDLLRALWDNALRAGVSLDTGEVHHFSRWAFSIARDCASVGLVSEAKELLSIARASAHGDRAVGRGLRSFECLASTIGWRAAGKLARLTKWLRSQSSFTLPQSWNRLSPAKMP